MASNESIGKTLTVAVLLCIVCSLVVSTAAVMLQPAQKTNQALDLKRNILAAADMLDPERSIEEQFEAIEIAVLDFSTGKLTDEVTPAEYDRGKMLRDPEMSTRLGQQEDIAKIKAREDYGLVYLVRDSDGFLEKIILPVRGYGLWSTLYGFLALESDANTVAGLGFYQHGETPGLGGEVDNPNWQSKWPGKKVYQGDDVALELARGSVDTSKAGSEYRVDGLAGATLTSKGISNMIDFWMGEMGYSEFLQRVRDGEV